MESWLKEIRRTYPKLRGPRYEEAYDRGCIDLGLLPPKKRHWAGGNAWFRESLAERVATLLGERKTAYVRDPHGYLSNNRRMAAFRDGLRRRLDEFEIGRVGGSGVYRVFAQTLTEARKGTLFSKEQKKLGRKRTIDLSLVDFSSPPYYNNKRLWVEHLVRRIGALLAQSGRVVVRDPENRLEDERVRIEDLKRRILDEAVELLKDVQDVDPESRRGRLDVQKKRSGEGRIYSIEIDLSRPQVPQKRPFEGKRPGPYESVESDELTELGLYSFGGVNRVQDAQKTDLGYQEKALLTMLSNGIPQAVPDRLGYHQAAMDLASRGLISAVMGTSSAMGPSGEAPDRIKSDRMGSPTRTGSATLWRITPEGEEKVRWL